MIGKILITLQAVFCTLLFWMGVSAVLHKPLLWPVTVLGIAISAAGVWSMKKATNKITVTPEPYEGTPLCETGIYHLIRHPMYSGLLIAFAMFAIACENSFLGWGVWLGLLIVLWGKIRIEERLLETQIPAYREYRTRTKRLIPLVW